MNFSKIIVKYRWYIIGIYIAITLFFGLQFPKLQMDPNMKNMLPDNLTSKMNDKKIEDIFGGTDMLMVIFETEDVLQTETLTRIKKISKKMKRIKGVDKVLSLFELKNIIGEEGSMIVDPAVKKIPENPEQKEKVRKDIINNDMVYGSVVSKDFRITTIIAMLNQKASDKEILEKVNALLKKYPGNEKVLLGGLPNTRINFERGIKKDIGKLLPIGIFIMLIFLFVCFKEMRGVILPFIVVIMSIIVSVGMMPLFGWKFVILSILAPIILVAVANDYGIHMIARYQELNIPGNNLKPAEIAVKIYKSLNKPVLLTGLTTIAGMLGLLGHILISARHLGIQSAISIFFALSASLFFIPAIISLLPKSRPVIGQTENNKVPVLEKILSFFSEGIIRKPRLIITTALIFATLISIGIFFVKIDADPIKYFTKKSPIVQSANIINKNLGGTYNLSIMFEGDIKSPDVMKDIDEVEKYIEKLPHVGNTSSIARVLKMMSRAMNNEGDKWYNKIPDTREAIAQYLLFYSMSGDPADFEKMIDFPYEHALITVRIDTANTDVINNILKEVELLKNKYPSLKMLGGFVLIISDIAKAVINGQFISLFIAIIAVGLMLSILFKSPAAGLIASIPLAISISLLFGLMGIFKIELNIATAMLSSIMIGVGIDYTIHFLWRYKEERMEGNNPSEAVKITLMTTGRGIIFNAFSVIIGFSVLMISNFMPVRFFGFLVVISIFSCLAGALIFIPALCIVIRPKFLEPDSGKQN